MLKTIVLIIYKIFVVETICMVNLFKKKDNLYINKQFEHTPVKFPIQFP